MNNHPNNTSFWQEARLTLNLALPMIAALLAQIAMELVDTVMMGRLGPEALAAGGLGSAIFITLLVFCLGIIISVGTLIAHAFGGERYYEIRHIGRQGLWLALFLSLPGMLILWFAPKVLPWIGQTPHIAALCAQYLHGLLWTFFPTLGFLCLREFISALSRPKIVMLITLFAVPLNILFNYIFMYGKWGLPAMGVQGIGFATALVQWLMLISLVIYISQHPHFRRYALFQQMEWPHFKKIIELVRLGWPIGVTLLFEVGLFSVTAVLMGSLGTLQLAAHQIALQTGSVVYMIPLGMAQATTLRVGHAMGAKRPFNAKKIAHISLMLGLVFALITALCFWFFALQIVGLYLNRQDPANQQVILYAVTFLKIAAIFQLMDVVQGITNGALRGIKDTFIPMMLGLISYWGSGLVSGYVLAFYFGWGGAGLWWGLAIGIAVSALVLYTRFYFKINEKIQLAQKI